MQHQIKQFDFVTLRQQNGNQTAIVVELFKDDSCAVGGGIGCILDRALAGKTRWNAYDLESIARSR